MSRSLELTRRNQNRRPCLAAILRCSMVVVGKGFRASTVWASIRKDEPEQQQKRTFLSANLQMVFSMATDA
jgi:hypothetical protein